MTTGSSRLEAGFVRLGFDRSGVVTVSGEHSVGFRLELGQVADGGSDGGAGWLEPGSEGERSGPVVGAEHQAVEVLPQRSAGALVNEPPSPGILHGVTNGSEEPIQARSPVYPVREPKLDGVEFDSARAAQIAVAVDKSAERGAIGGDGEPKTTRNHERGLSGQSDKDVGFALKKSP